MWLTWENILSFFGIAESFFTIAAIVGAGAYAIVKLRVFRDLKPHLTMRQSVSHRRVGSDYIHVAATATLFNSSKVAIELRRSFSRAQTVSPLSKQEIEQLYEDAFSDAENQGFLWPTLQRVNHSWEEGELIVEPGEAHAQTYEFVIGATNETILIYTYCFNPNPDAGRGEAEGWAATTVYDIVNGKGATDD